MSSNDNYSRKTQRKVYAPVEDSTSPLHVGSDYVDSRKGSGSVFLWIILALLVCGALVGGYYFFLRGDDVPAAVVVEDDGEEDAREETAVRDGERRYESRSDVDEARTTEAVNPFEKPEVATPEPEVTSQPQTTPAPVPAKEPVATQAPVDKGAVSSSGGKRSVENVDTKEAVSSSSAQSKVYELSEVVTKPQFPGGDAAMYQWMSQNITYPAAAAEEGVSGRVIVGFIIETDGSISNARILRSRHAALDKEALRLVNSMPRWTPGRANNLPVRTSYTLPVSFKLQ